MNKVIPLKAHQDAAVAVFRDISLTIQQRLDSWDFAAGRTIIDHLTKFLRKYRNELGDTPFGLELTQINDPSKPELTPRAITRANTNNASLISLDCELRILKISPLNCSMNLSESILSAASTGTVIAHYENKSLVRFFADCLTARCINLDDPVYPPGRIVRMRYVANQYRLAIRDHYRHRVKYWQETDHWADRTRRRLYSRLGSCSKTEDIFHRSLARWLELHLDGDVKSKPRDTTGDEPDIQITELGGRIFLVEIKWLGRNEKTIHDLKWLKGAMNQFGKYLSKQPTVTSATIVAYDARSKDKFEALNHVEEVEDGCRLIEECAGARVPARGDCMVFYLESTTASQS